MKGVFWNSRGLEDLAKHRYLKDLVKAEQIDFIALIETGRDQFPNGTLKKLSGGKEFIWHCMAPHGRSGGILLGVDLTVFDIGSIDEGDFYVKFTLRTLHKKMTYSDAHKGDLQLSAVTPQVKVTGFISARHLGPVWGCTRTR